ncbi:MAG: aldehyde-activating protein [Deltaproteobacteria bacterium]|nr:MAG: aldehyde-activating protein [Deltaproteobacteria bacterium]
MSGRDTPRSEAPLTGRCHCGNLELALETSLRPEELSLRADTCSFCRKHGARTTSDPSGRVMITVHHPDELLRYLFGLETADFLVCTRCGIYVAAVMEEGSGSYATVNVNTLDAVDRFTRPATPVTYEGESAAERSARRKARWTPAVIVEERR